MSLKNRLSTVEVHSFTFRKIYIISLPISKHIKDKHRPFVRPKKHSKKLLMLKMEILEGLLQTN